jgi:putative hemolysin
LNDDPPKRWLPFLAGMAALLVWSIASGDTVTEASVEPEGRQASWYGVRLGLLAFFGLLAALCFMVQTALSAEEAEVETPNEEAWRTERACWFGGLLYFSAQGVILVDTLIRLAPGLELAAAAVAGLLAIAFQFIILDSAGRNVSLLYPGWVRRWLGRAADIATVPVRPLVAILFSVTRESTLSRDEWRLRHLRNTRLRLLPHVHGVDRLVDEEEADMIDSVREFAERTAGDIMTPRIDIEGVPLEIPVADLIARLRMTDYSRIVVYDGNLDNVVGTLLAKEVLLNLHRKPMEFLREPMIVSRDMKLPDLLRMLRKSRAHMAIVLDEYGGTSGLVTLHDLFEEIVGDHIPDEEDEEDFWIEEAADGEVVHLNGRVELWEVNEDLELELDESIARTIGGFVADQLGHLPAPEEKLEVEGGTFIVEEVANNRVQRLRFEREHERADLPEEIAP